jgi:Tol biopolymer transport system component
MLHSHICITDVEGNSERVVYSSPEHFEAPNWSPDGSYLLLNSRGKLWRLPISGDEPVLVATGAIANLNNDHGISPDGSLLAISAGAIFTLPATGGEPRRITEKTPSYFHGWSPDGATLTYCARRDDVFNLYAISVEGGEEVRLTSGAGPDDAPTIHPMDDGFTSTPIVMEVGASGAFPLAVRMSQMV